jgi:hypothetical protein
MQSRFIVRFLCLGLLCFLFSTYPAQAERLCSTIPNALGFDSEQSLDRFVSLAKAAKKDPSKADEMKAALDQLSSKQKAFELHGNDNVKILKQLDPSDDELGKIKVKSDIDGKVFWVPAAALDCN